MQKNIEGKQKDKMTENFGAARELHFSNKKRRFVQQP